MHGNAREWFSSRIPAQFPLGERLKCAQAALVDLIEGIENLRAGPIPCGQRRFGCFVARRLRRMLIVMGWHPDIVWGVESNSPRGIGGNSPETSISQRRIRSWKIVSAEKGGA